MRFIIGQWVIIGILLGLVGIVWEHIVDPFQIGLPFKLWLTAIISWVVAHIFLLLVYWVCMSLMTQKEGEITGLNLMLWGIAFTCYDIALNLTNKTFLHRTPPIPLLKLYGLKCGKGFSAGIGAQIGDPDLVKFGDNCRIGGYSITTAHFVEGKRAIRKKIEIGNNVEIGGMSLIGPGVTIEENVVVGALTLIPKEVHLKGSTVYGGVPARRIMDLRPGMAGTKKSLDN